MDTKNAVLRCDSCFYATYFQFCLDVHQVRNHNTHPENYFACIEPPCSYTCNTCDFEVGLKMNLYQHIKVIHQNKLLKDVNSLPIRPEESLCKNCDFKSYSMLFLAQHQTTCDGSMTKKDSPLFVCSYCDKKSSYEHVIKRHIAARHVYKKSKLFQCGFCRFNTKHMGSLNRHILNMHEPNREWFNCQFCTYYTTCRKLYLKHRSYKHSQDIILVSEKFVCATCDFKCDYEGSFVEHMRKAHDGAKKPFMLIQCDECDFKTVYKDYLKIHKLQHGMVKSKKLKCTECKYRTHFPENLCKHLVKKHGKIGEVV